MRSTTEFTRGYQVWYMIKREIFGVCICALVQFMLFMSSYNNDAFRIVSGVLFSVVHFLIIYDGAAALGKLDKKTYTPNEYDIKWSVLWGIVIAGISTAFMVVFKLNWRFGAVDGVLANPASLVINVLYYIWQSPYMAFMVMKANYLPVAVVILSCALPVVASVVGYISGKHNFTLSDKLSSIMFEKDKKNT